ncbi:MAG: hypothetical protein KA436_06280 [Oligoflexales bacterium]|nr:hypothetical protein [Oligoflexales bacterium]
MGRFVKKIFFLSSFFFLAFVGAFLVPAYLFDQANLSPVLVQSFLYGLFVFTLACSLFTAALSLFFASSFQKSKKRALVCVFFVVFLMILKIFGSALAIFVGYKHALYPILPMTCGAAIGLGFFTLLGLSVKGEGTES